MPPPGRAGTARAPLRTEVLPAQLPADLPCFTGRDEARVQLVEDYARAQGLFRTDDSPEAIYSETLELDLTTVEPSVAGPRRPQDRVTLDRVRLGDIELNAVDAVKEYGQGDTRVRALDAITIAGVRDAVSSFDSCTAASGSPTTISRPLALITSTWLP